VGLGRLLPRHALNAFSRLRCILAWLLRRPRLWRQRSLLGLLISTATMQQLFVAAVAIRRMLCGRGGCAQRCSGAAQSPPRWRAEHQRGVGDGGSAAFGVPAATLHAATAAAARMLRRGSRAAWRRLTICR